MFGKLAGAVKSAVMGGGLKKPGPGGSPASAGPLQGGMGGMMGGAAALAQRAGGAKPAVTPIGEKGPMRKRAFGRSMRSRR